jgi:sugar transferase (PEP-CTERM system associated)
MQMGGEREVHASRILPAESLRTAVGRYGIDEVLVASRDRREGKLPVEELLACKLSGVRVTDLSDFYERERGRLPVESMSASWMAFGEGFNQQWPQEAIKVAFDLLISACLLVVALPVMILTAILIRLEDGGPVFYRQERVGRGVRPFTMLKFRSMGQDAEKDGKARWASVGDARVTRVGRVIRKIRIDELPQLINVLRGEMSFVGPRPERPCFVAELVKQIPYYNVRHTVKPGITGWAQVRHPYSDSISGTTDKLQYDLYYVKNHSLFLDLLIAIETVGVVLWGKGAR